MTAKTKEKPEKAILPKDSRERAIFRFGVRTGREEVLQEIHDALGISELFINRMRDD